MTVMFIFAVIGITSCQKSELGLDETEGEFSEEVEINISQETVSIDDVIESLKNEEQIISVKENYIHAETGIKGTLYEYKDYDGTIKEILKADKEPKNIDKAWIRSVVAVDYQNTTYYRCLGSGSNCFGFQRLYIAWS
ncbi:MAG: hypothetical protein K8R54_08235 [Bacteroidales bacterium]|nr:hypothetical protein [Bacteroidales bacterium]